MIYNYPYLSDKNFLQRFDLLRIKEQFVKITLLDFATERPVLTLEGRSLGGTININGTSAMRRSANINVLTTSADNDLSIVESKISINKKVEIEIGFKNTTTEWTDYDKIWFPQGIYIIYNVNFTNSNMAALTISLTLRDKMSLLNGDCGGTIPAAVTLHEMDTVDENGNPITVRTPIREIIREVVSHFGEEDVGRILISDLDETIFTSLSWINGTDKAYIYPNDEAHLKKFLTTDREVAVGYIQQEFPGSTQEEIDALILEIDQYMSIGKEETPFVYAGTAQLNATPGQTVLNILDSINQYLGNAYEYFYDLNGNFVWQEIKNYLVTSQATIDLERAFTFSGDDYLIDRSNGKIVFAFDDGSQILSYSNNPQYNLIKNDFIVWGSQQTSDSSIKKPIRYHLAIDTKPSLLDFDNNPKIYHVYKYIEDDKQFAINPIILSSVSELVLTKGSLDTFYLVGDTLYKWVPIENSKGNFVTFSEDEIIVNEEEITDETTFVEKTVYVLDGQQYLYYNSSFYLFDLETFTMYWYQMVQVDENTFELVYVQPTDWRTVLYLEGVESEPYGTNSNYYYLELKNEWPKIYNIFGDLSEAGTAEDPYKGSFKEDLDLLSLDYFLDFIDTTNKVSELKIDNIGRRTKVINDSKVNCLFEPSTLDICVFSGGTSAEEEIFEKEMINSGQKYLILDSNISDNDVNIGVYYNSAFETIKQQLYTFTNYNQNISLSMLPIYYLEPNIRIRVQDIDSNIYGDYMIQTLSIPLDISSQMTLTAIKALDRF